MRINYNFKTDVIDTETGTLFFHMKLPLYLFTKFFNKESSIFKIIYNSLFISEIMISENTEDGEFSIEYNHSRFCSGEGVPHRIGMGNSEDILHDSVEMISTLRNAYAAAKLSELLKYEYEASEDFRNKISALCDDLGADKSYILDSDCAIGVYESMCKEAKAYFEDEKTKDDSKVKFYQTLLNELDEFTKKKSSFLNDHLFYLFSTITPIGVRFRISNLLAYSIQLNKDYYEEIQKEIQDPFELEFVLQFMKYIHFITKK